MEGVQASPRRAAFRKFGEDGTAVSRASFLPHGIGVQERRPSFLD